MRVIVPPQSSVSTILAPTIGKEKISRHASTLENGNAEDQEERYINMASGRLVTFLGWSIWGFIAGLNVYLIVMLCLGK